MIEHTFLCQGQRVGFSFSAVVLLLGPAADVDLRLLVALGAAEVVDSPVVADSAQVVDSTDSADPADPDVLAASLQVWSNETES